MRVFVVLCSFAALAVCSIGWSSTANSSAPVTYQGQTAFQWHRLAVVRRVERDTARGRAGDAIRAFRALRRNYVRQPSSMEALRLAAVAYSVPLRLLARIAMCESTGSDPDVYPASERTLYAKAENDSSTAAGLGQFLDSTWSSSPYARFSVFSPYANALAMAHEVAAGHLWQWAASRRCWS